MFKVAVAQYAKLAPDHNKDRKVKPSLGALAAAFMAFFFFNSMSDPKGGGAGLYAQGLTQLSQRSGYLPAHLDDECSQKIPTFSL